MFIPNRSSFYYSASAGFQQGQEVRFTRFGESPSEAIYLLHGIAYQMHAK